MARVTSAVEVHHGSEIREYMFWSDHDSRELIRTDFPWFLHTFDAYKHPIQRADAIRYFVLYKYGGVYCDMDVRHRIKISPHFSSMPTWFLWKLRTWV